MLTLITDASYGGPGWAGWGAWAKADGVDSRFWSGPIERHHVANPSEAEMAAVLYGFEQAVHYGPGHDVLVQSDSARVLRLLRANLGFGESKHRDGLSVGAKPMDTTPTERVLMRIICRVRQRAGVAVLVRHVKGHVAGAKGRHWVNERCDQAAKGHMHTLRHGPPVPAV